MKIHPKVVAQTAVGTVSGFVMWLLMVSIPAWHHSVPVDVQAAIPGVVAVVLGFAAGFLKKETAGIDTVESLVTRAETVFAEVEQVVNSLANPPAPPAAS